MAKQPRPPVLQPPTRPAPLKRIPVREPVIRAPKAKYKAKSKAPIPKGIESGRKKLGKLRAKFDKSRDPKAQSQINNLIDEINRLSEIRDPPYRRISRNFRGQRVVYRVYGRDERVPETFFVRVRPYAFRIIREELFKQHAIRVQFILSIEFTRSFSLDSILSCFNSRAAHVLHASDVSDIISELYDNLIERIGHPALPRSGFVLNKILFMDVRISQNLVTFHCLKSFPRQMQR